MAAVGRGVVVWSLVVCVSAVAAGSSGGSAPVERTDLIVYASPKYDPGVTDFTGKFSAAIVEQASEAMSNAEYVPNDDPESPLGEGTGITTWDDGHPAPPELVDFTSWWNPSDGVVRHPVLLVEDMEMGYAEYVDYVLPNCERLLAKFREYGAPMVWTNWVRRFDDQLYGALDRFYGPQGTASEENPTYVYGRDATETVPSLAPQTEAEWARTIKSLHLSKFADVDENGELILYSMLTEWGVDTIVLVGAWTEDCILATVYEAVDRYGFDVIMVVDGVATATSMHGTALKVAKAALAYEAYTTDVIGLMDMSFGDGATTTNESTGPYFSIAPNFDADRVAYPRRPSKLLRSLVTSAAPGPLAIRLLPAILLASLCSLLSAAAVTRYYSKRLAAINKIEYSRV